MREEPRRDDVYAWSRPRVPEGNPYIWMDAEQITGGRPLNEAPTTHEPVVDEIGPEAPSEEVLETEANVIPFPAHLAAEIAAEPAPEAEVLVAANAPVEDVWVELPPAPEPAAKPARARRSRAKAKPAAEAVTEAEQAPAEAPAPAEPEPVVAEAAPEPVVEAAPEPEPAVAATPEPEPAPAPKPVVIPADEILSPPEKPKRGWWRRNG
jgi:ribonuclease E